MLNMYLRFLQSYFAKKYPNLRFLLSQSEVSTNKTTTETPNLSINSKFFQFRSENFCDPTFFSEDKILRLNWICLSISLFFSMLTHSVPRNYAKLVSQRPNFVCFLMFFSRVSFFGCYKEDHKRTNEAESEVKSLPFFFERRLWRGD